MPAASAVSPSATSSPAWRRLAPLRIPGFSRTLPCDGDAILLHHHGVGALRHWRASKDADRLARPDRTAKRVARRRPATDRQLGLTVVGQIGMPDGVAVDGTVGMRRQIYRGDQIVRQNAPDGGAKRYGLGINDRDDAFVDPGERLVHAQQRATKGKAVIAQLCHRAHRHNTE